MDGSLNGGYCFCYGYMLILFSTQASNSTATATFTLAPTAVTAAYATTAADSFLGK